MANRPSRHSQNLDVGEIVVAHKIAAAAADVAVVDDVGVERKDRGRRADDASCEG